MKPEEETLGEASQMLRDILKNSGKESPGHSVKDNNNTLKTLDTIPNLSPLNTHCAASESENQDTMKSALCGKSSAPKAKHAEDSEDHSESFNNLSSEESDPDNSLGQTNDQDDTQKENDGERDRTTCPPNSLSPSDSKEAKRARVENILTSIRQSPQSGLECLAQATYNDMKRQKRKQPQPQQHEVKASRASKPKYRKLECLVLHEHILQLQKQLHAVKKSVSQISRCSSDEEDKEVHTIHEDLENEEAVQATVLQTSHKEKDAVTQGQGFSPRNHQREETEHLSSNSLHLNGKLTREGAESKRCISKDSDSYNQQNGHLIVPTFQPSLSSQLVSLSLKSEIIQAVKRAVDSAVITVLEKHAGSLNNPQHENESEMQQQQEEQQQQEKQLQQHQQHLRSKSPTGEEDEVQQPLNVPRPRQEREALKETVSNSQTERPAELTIPYPDHLRFLERLSQHRQLSEKQGLFEPLLARNESSDLIKPHAGPALPFPPPFPYSSFMHAGAAAAPLPAARTRADGGPAPGGAQHEEEADQGRGHAPVSQRKVQLAAGPRQPRPRWGSRRGETLRCLLPVSSPLPSPCPPDLRGYRQPEPASLGTLRGFPFSRNRLRHSSAFFARR